MKEKLRHLVIKTEQDTGYIKITAKEQDDSYIIDVQYSMKNNGIKQVIKGATKIVESIFRSKE